MFFESVYETRDRSYYVDRLQKLTGKPRTYWAGIPLEVLKNYFKKEIRKREVFKYGQHSVLSKGRS